MNAPNGSKVNMKHIAVENHFPHIGRKVTDAYICHALLDFYPFIWGQPNMELRIPNTFLSHNHS